MITLFDRGIIAFYFVFVLGVGLAFRSLSKNTSDYFRAGGAMPWWITGTSAWIAGFSAWTFVGAAGKVYETGTLVLWAFYPTVGALLLVYYFTCVRFRRLRVVTWMEAVRGRYGQGTEQFYTWVKVPLSLLLAGVSLNAVGVFMASVFGMPMYEVLMILGSIVTVVALVGGAWAVLASDFVQMFLIVTITIVTAVLTLAQPKVGGLHGLINRVPSAHFHWTQIEQPGVLIVWAMAQVWFKFSDSNNMENSTMYLMAKNDRNARKMVLIPLIGTLIGPLIWFIPSMAATITHPNLAAEFPNLPQPHEAAFVAAAHDVLPVGLIGLLVCAMLGATLTSMDAGLNKNVGVFVRSFYCPIVAPRASEKHLLWISKISTLAFGVMVIAIALEVNKLRTVGLFQLTNLLAATLLMPMALPLLYGLFFKRTPAWSAWSTALVGFLVAYLCNYRLNLDHLAAAFGWHTPLRVGEIDDFKLGVVTLSTVVVGSIWYFATSFFYSRAPLEYRENLQRFFTNLATPIDARAEGIVDMDEIIYRMMGLLCLVFGTFVLLLALIVPNAMTGRLCFVFCGGSIFIMGGLLYLRSRVLDQRRAMASIASYERHAAPSPIGAAP